MIKKPELCDMHGSGSFFNHSLIIVWDSIPVFLNSLGLNPGFLNSPGFNSGFS